MYGPWKAWRVILLMANSEPLQFCPEHNHLFAPFFIFIKCGDKLSDAALLDHFGIGHYQEHTEPDDSRPCAIIARDGTWVHLVDDWRYSLWHVPETRKRIAALAETYDVFACSVGDCDRSYDFEYYKDAKLVRRYVVSDPRLSGGMVTRNVGAKLAGETGGSFLGRIVDDLRGKDRRDELTEVMQIASGIGITINHTETPLAIYCEPQKTAEK